MITYLIGQCVTAQVPLSPAVAHHKVHRVPWSVEAFGVLTHHSCAVVELLERFGMILDQCPRVDKNGLHVTRRRHQANVPCRATVDAFVILKNNCNIKNQL